MAMSPPCASDSRYCSRWGKCFRAIKSWRLGVRDGHNKYWSCFIFPVHVCDAAHHHGRNALGSTRLPAWRCIVLEHSLGIVLRNPLYIHVNMCTPTAIALPAKQVLSILFSRITIWFCAYMLSYAGMNRTNVSYTVTPTTPLALT